MPLIPGEEVARQAQRYDGAVEEAAAQDFAGGGTDQGDEEQKGAQALQPRHGGEEGEHRHAQGEDRQGAQAPSGEGAEVLFEEAFGAAELVVEGMLLV